MFYVYLTYYIYGVHDENNVHVMKVSHETLKCLRALIRYRSCSLDSLYENVTELKRLLF